jgi:hypothetical protein
MKTDFQNCAALTDIKLAANISIIKNAFRNCTHLKTINLAGDIKSIGTSAFRNCGNNNSTLTPGKITGDIKIEQKNTFFSNAIAKKLPADK